MNYSLYLAFRAPTNTSELAHSLTHSLTYLIAYLAFLAAVDNVCLIFMFAVWFGWIGIPVFQMNGPYAGVSRPLQ